MYGSNDMTFWKGQTGDSKKISGCGVGGMNRCITEDLGGTENSPHGAVLMGTRHCTLSASTEGTSPGGALRPAWVIMAWVIPTCQCRFISWTGGAALVGKLTVGGCASVSAGGVWEEVLTHTTPWLV